MGRQGKYPAEVRERAVRLVLDHQDENESQWAAVTSVAAKVGCSRESLRMGIRQAEPDSGKREGLTTDERARMKQLELENRELRPANEILRKASAYFAKASIRPATEAMTRFIGDHREGYGVESMCRVIPIAPSTCYGQKARETDPSHMPLRL